MKAEFPLKLQCLFKPKRYKILKGGRGGAKSWGIARALLILGRQKKLRIVCAREFQKTLADSVMALLVDQIDRLGMRSFYRTTKTAIYGKNGTRFIFVGLRHNPASIKSLEGADICWVEEAHVVSKASWDMLIPTVRKEGSEIWVSFNPELETDDTFQRFITHTPPDAIVVDINWRDNPWFPATLRAEMEHMKATRPGDYDHIYEGQCVSQVEGAIFAEQLKAAEREGRIRQLPYDRSRPVDVFWDLGFGDICAAWFVQTFPIEYRLIDYIQNSRKDMAWYLAQLQQRGYVYGTMYMPWDIGLHAPLMGKGKSVEGIMRDHGFKVKILPKLRTKAEGIEASRMLFPLCWFDRERCADGLSALRHYRYGVVGETEKAPDPDNKKQTVTREPVHDWTSHGSDAFHHIAIGTKEPAPPKKPDQPLERQRYSEGGWMA